MRYFITLIFAIFSGSVIAQDWEDHKKFNSVSTRASLRIISSTDTSLFVSILEGFVKANPNIGIEYLVTDTANLDQQFRSSPDAYDIAISSAMDLQLKLANDGFAKALPSVSHPDWATWRQSLFAFTREPAAIVINRAAFAGQPIPQSRQDLIEALRKRPEIFKRRVGTYDIRQSGLGYFFATQDARTSETFWRLMEVFGGLEVKLHCCSGEMIDALIDGRLAVAYNVLGSYAMARSNSEDSIQIIQPDDFETTMMRTALVSKSTQQEAAATAFIRYLTEFQRRSVSDNISSSLPILDSENIKSQRARIKLGPELLTFLDLLKRRKFLVEWENAMIQN